MEIVKLTGKTIKGYVEYIDKDELTGYAKPVHSANMFIPTEEFIKEAPKIMGVISYRKPEPIQDKDEPLYLGFIFVNGEEETFDFPNKKFRFTEKFKEIIDDKEEVYELKNSQQSIALDKNRIKLGKEATEQALLGNKAVELFGELLDAIMQLTVLSPVGTTSTPLNFQDFIIIKQKLNTLLSKINYIE